MPANMADRDPSLPPYLVLEEDADEENTDTEQSMPVLINRLRQLEVPEIFNFIEDNLTRFAQLNMSSCLIFYGGKESGKSTFLFQTSFFNMLTD